MQPPGAAGHPPVHPSVPQPQDFAANHPKGFLGNQPYYETASSQFASGLHTNAPGQNVYHPAQHVYPPSQPTYQPMQYDLSGTVPSHHFRPQQPQQPPHFQHQQSAEEQQYSYDWITDSVGRQIMVRTPLPRNQPVRQNLLVTPPQQYRTEFRCSPTTGRQWSVQVPVMPSTPATQQTYEWRCDAQTGERYRVLVPSQQQPSNQLPASSARSVPPQGQPQQFSFQHPNQHYVSPNVTVLPSPDIPQQAHNSISQFDEQQNNSLSRHERVAGIVSLLEGGGGTRKVPTVLEFAKKCPTKWSKYATLSNINLPLYAWGVIEEVESSLSGRSQALQSSVILGKLRHLKNTLEVCCQNSTSQEFTGYGWTLAKDYATKFNDEIEQGRETWQDMRLEVKTSTLMSANMENPRPPPKYETRKVKETEKKELCTTYNKCTTENKCDYEVANPTKTCLRKHECTWCRANKNQSWSHQALKCRNKRAADGSG